MSSLIPSQRDYPVLEATRSPVSPNLRDHATRSLPGCDGWSNRPPNPFRRKCNDFVIQQKPVQAGLRHVVPFRRIMECLRYPLSLSWMQVKFEWFCWMSWNIGPARTRTVPRISPKIRACQAARGKAGMDEQTRKRGQAALREPGSLAGRRPASSRGEVAREVRSHHSD